MDKTVTINNHFLDYIEDWEHYEYFLLGSYGSSKSFNTAIKLVIKAIKEKRKILVVRKVFATLKDSCYEDIKEAINILGLDNHFRVLKSPLEIHCRNGSKFLFKGLDDKRKLKSIKDVSIVWIEEAEATLEDYKELKDRMRVKGVDTHIIITTNPVSKQHWIYTNFFQDEEEKIFLLDEKRLYGERVIKERGIYHHHSTYKDNIFLNPSWIKNLENERNELLRSIKIKGEFGSVGHKVFTNLTKIDTETLESVKQRERLEHYRGLDFGYVTSYNALVECCVDRKHNNLYIYNEYYKRKQSNMELMKGIEHLKGSWEIRCDAAEPKTIAELKKGGFYARPCKKGVGSVKNGIKKLQGFDNIYIVESCKNVWREFNTLEHPKDDRTGKVNEDKYNIDPHTVDAMRYALDKFGHFNLKDRASRKPIGT